MSADRRETLPSHVAVAHGGFALLHTVCIFRLLAGPRSGYDRLHPSMDRRKQAPEAHPLVSGFPCPMCASTRVRLGTVAVYYFYLRCDACAHVWSQPERREVTVRRPYPLII